MLYKNFIAGLFCLLLSLITVKAGQPNVLFIAVDDMNDWIGSLNNDVQAKTPNIDKLAARGVNFSNAHTPGVYCAPARTAIFTGQYASTTGIYQYQVYHATHPHLVPMQVSFKNAGYNTYGTGKLFHHTEGQVDLRGWNEFRVRTKRQRKTGWPLDSWSDEMPFPPQGKQTKENKILYSKNGQKKWGVMANEKEAEMADTIRADWTIAKLKEKHNKPFFIGMGLYAPHIPNYIPQKYYDMYDKNNIPRPELKADDLDDLPEPVRTQRMKRKKSAHDPLVKINAVNEATHHYLASMSYADAQVGRVLDALATSSYAHNTIVVLWSDHGWHLGEKGQWGKKLLWERTSNVPFIWAGPNIAKGKKTDVTVSLIDMYPTFIELCGLQSPDQKLDGLSISATLKNPEAARDRKVYLPDRFPGSYAMISRDWRYIKYDNGSEELYNLKNDPNEWFNLASKPEYDNIKKEMSVTAPKTFAKPAPDKGSKKDLIIEAESFHWNLSKKKK